MSDHLPECPMQPIAEAPVDFHQVFPDCICSALRACEQRVLSAARERIMRLPYEIDEEILVDRDEVIGWIDALREEKK